MKNYVVHIEQTFETEYYLSAESAESAESIVYFHVLGGGWKEEIKSNEINDFIEVTDVYLDCQQN